tara:strand:- start:19 stop:189 length:171 start_codon:yes stop_codon:yes gene_type:complete
MNQYSKRMEILHKKLLQATTKDQEDRIVNLMLAEAKLYRKTEELKALNLKDSNSTA